MLRAILNSKCSLHKCRSRRSSQRSRECSLPSVVSLLESSGPRLAPTNSAQPLHGSTEVSSSNAHCHLEPCSAFVLVPWPGSDRRKDFCAVFMGCEAGWGMWWPGLLTRTCPGKDSLISAGALNPKALLASPEPAGLLPMCAGPFLCRVVIAGQLASCLPGPR